MTYTKPENIRYVDMAIWIDTHAYTNDSNENLLYEYLYHLANMLAHKHSYFTTSEDYDQFALYTASKLFSRLKNSELPPIKSILNYIKKIIYPYKVDYDAEFRKDGNADIQIIYTGDFNLGSYLIDEANIFERINFTSSLSSIDRVVYAHLSKIPVRKNSSEWVNIYISCMLTLLNSITLSKYNLKKCEHIKKDKSHTIDHIYTTLRHAKPILFHLDKKYENYIYILVNEIRRAISKELSGTTDYYISPDSTIKGLLMENFYFEE